MKVKGWVTMDRDTNIVIGFSYVKKYDKPLKLVYGKKNTKLLFKLEPCTITIHDKAVDK
jgi:hypothetical protein